MQYLDDITSCMPYLHATEVKKNSYNNKCCHCQCNSGCSDEEVAKIRKKKVSRRLDMECKIKFEIFTHV